MFSFADVQLAQVLSLTVYTSQIILRHKLHDFKFPFDTQFRKSGTTQSEAAKVCDGLVNVATKQSCSQKLAQKDGLLQAVLHFCVLQVGFEVLAVVQLAAAHVIQIFRSSGTNDVVSQQDAAFPQKATLL